MRGRPRVRTVAIHTRPGREPTQGRVAGESFTLRLPQNPLCRSRHNGFGGRPRETNREQSRHRARGRPNRTLLVILRLQQSQDHGRVRASTCCDTPPTSFAGPSYFLQIAVAGPTGMSVHHRHREGHLRRHLQRRQQPRGGLSPWSHDFDDDPFLEWRRLLSAVLGTRGHASPALVPGDGTSWPGGALRPGWVFCSRQRRRASEPRDVASHPREVRLAAGSSGRIWGVAGRPRSGRCTILRSSRRSTRLLGARPQWPGGRAETTR
jgi:hypothetical protein